MLYLKIVLHNKINYPVFLEIPIPAEVMNAIRCSPITNAEFLFYEKSPEGKIVTPSIYPKNSAKTELNDFEIKKG